MRKIIIIGCPGSGKSYLARKLHEITRIPLYHLDNIWWRADGTHISRDEFDKELDSILSTDAWILDGDYSRTYEIRIKSCDTVLFLDFDESQCLLGIEARNGKERDDCPLTSAETDPSLVDEVRKYRTKNRPAVLALLDKYSDKEIIRFHDRREADEWVHNL